MNSILLFSIFSFASATYYRSVNKCCKPEELFFEDQCLSGGFYSSYNENFNISLEYNSSYDYRKCSSNRILHRDELFEIFENGTLTTSTRSFYIPIDKYCLEIIDLEVQPLICSDDLNVLHFTQPWYTGHRRAFKESSEESGFTSDNFTSLQFKDHWGNLPLIHNEINELFEVIEERFGKFQIKTGSVNKCCFEDEILTEKGCSKYYQPRNYSIETKMNVEYGFWHYEKCNSSSILTLPLNSSLTFLKNQSILYNTWIFDKEDYCFDIFNSDFTIAFCLRQKIFFPSFDKIDKCCNPKQILHDLNCKDSLDKMELIFSESFELSQNNVTFDYLKKHECKSSKIICPREGNYLINPDRSISIIEDRMQYRAEEGNYCLDIYNKKLCLLLCSPNSFKREIHKCCAKDQILTKSSCLKSESMEVIFSAEAELIANFSNFSYLSKNNCTKYHINCSIDNRIYEEMPLEASNHCFDIFENKLCLAVCDSLEASTTSYSKEIIEDIKLDPCCGKDYIFNGSNCVTITRKTNLVATRLVESRLNNCPNLVAIKNTSIILETAGEIFIKINDFVKIPTTMNQICKQGFNRETLRMFCDEENISVHYPKHFSRLNQSERYTSEKTYRLVGKESVTVRKCCKPNYSIINNTCLKTDTSLSLLFYREEILSEEKIDYELFREEGYNSVLICNSTDGGFYLQENGSLYFKNEEIYIDSEEFCIDDFEDEDCFLWFLNKSELREDQKSISSTIYTIGMIISMPFLLATLLVYLIIPEKNLHMKALMFYVFSLLLGYIFLISTTLNTSAGQFVCKMQGYLTIFFFLVSFFWMNVICIDICLTFSGIRGFAGASKKRELIRFIYYCLYAWGVPIIILIILSCINETVPINAETSWFHPELGDGQCFLKLGYPYLFYFNGPMGLLLLSNIGLFIFTAVKIRQAKKDTAMLKKTDSKKHSYENNKQKYNLYLKLMFAMGINWTMEFISWAVNFVYEETPEYIWFVTDFINAIYGVFIFILFVCKKKIWNTVKKRFYVFIGRPQRAHLSTRSSRGMSTTYSTADTAFEDPTIQTNIDKQEEYALKNLQ